jgi:hypothetical protein
MGVQHLSAPNLGCAGTTSTNAHRSHIHLAQCTTMQTGSAQYCSCRGSFFMQEYRPEQDRPKYCSHSGSTLSNQTCTHCSLLFGLPRRTTPDPSTTYGRKTFRHSIFKLLWEMLLHPMFPAFGCPCRASSFVALPVLEVISFIRLSEYCLRQTGR